MNFKAGDAVVHPVRGAGVVDCIKERQWRGHSETYYRIQLQHPPGSKLMVPTSAAKELGLRCASSQIKLKKVWRVLSADPETLPTGHKERCAVLKDKLYTGNVFQVTEVVRDMAWRQQRKGRLTIVGKRMYDNGMTLLAGEIAAVQGIELVDAELEIKARLRESLCAAEVS